MSAEGKKKRGESGKSNAKNIPWRYHGRYPKGYFDKPVGRSDHPCGAGSRLVAAMILGIRLPGFSPSDVLLARTDAAMERMTSRVVK